MKRKGKRKLQCSLSEIDWIRLGLAICLAIFWLVVITAICKIVGNAQEPPESPYGDYIKVKTTAYCPCKKCCGKWADGGTTASGRKAVEGLTVASNKYYGKDILLYNEDFELIGIYECMDTGTDGIDIYMDSHQRALEFGVHYYHIQVIDGVG